jgi:hypothetical protein
MAESALQPNNRAVWMGAITLGGVAAVVVWAVRLVVPYQGLDLSKQGTGVIAVAVLACLIVLGALYAWFQSFPVVVGALVFLASFSGFLVLRAGNRPIVILVTFGVFVVTSMIVASEWTNRAMRIMLVFFAVAVLAVILRSGRAELEEGRVHDARGTAVSLYNKVAALTAEANTKSVALPAAAGSAYDTAHQVLLDAVGGKDLPQPGGCDTVPAGSVDASLCQLAPRLERDLRCIGHADVTGCQAVIDGFKVDEQPLAALRATAPLSAGERVRITAFAALVDAIEAAIIPPTAAAMALDSATKAVDNLCTAARGQAGKVSPRTCTATVNGAGRADNARALLLAEANAQQRVAAAQVVVHRSENATKDLSDADGALAVATAQKDDPAPGQSLDATIPAGAVRLARSVPGIGGTRVPLVLGQIGWGLLGGLALLGYRRLEILNRRRSRGLVTINKLQGADTHADYDAAFRRHVLSNVSEPGSIPGGTTEASITDLLGATNPVGIVKNVVAAISAITAITPDFELDATYRGPETSAADAGSATSAPGAITATATASAADDLPVTPNSGAPHQVFVRVRSARTKTTLKTNVVTAATADLALRSAGYWAAGYILSGDSTAPEWSRWTLPSATALAVYDDAAERGAPDAEEKLCAALALAPVSGLLLSALANTLELNGKPLETLDLNLRAATRYPRYPIARYRLAMSLSNLASDTARWDTTPLPAKRRILRSLCDCFRACNVKVETPPTTVEDLTIPMLFALAERFRAETLILFERRRVALAALRRSERRYWAPLLFTPDGRKMRSRAYETIDSAKYVIGERADPSGVDLERKEIEKEADEADGWQKVYNLACFCAVRSARTGPDDRRTALELLERIFGKDPGGQLTQEWVDRDPDLQNLKREARFATFRSWLPACPAAATREET